MVKTAKAGKYTDLAILGIGGSRHTTENITKLFQDIKIGGGLAPLGVFRLSPVMCAVSMLRVH